MTNFKAFSEGTEPKEVLSEPVVYINGLPWRILAKHNDDASFGLFLCCFGDETDMAWNCLANKQLSIVPCAKRGQKCQMKEGNPTDYDTDLMPRMCAGAGRNLQNLRQDVMNEQKGFYDAKDDAVTFKAQLSLNSPMECRNGLRTVDTLRVNGQLVYVNKFMIVLKAFQKVGNLQIPIGPSKQVLEAMNRSDFEMTGPTFMYAFLDYNKMDRYAMNELRERHRQLFGTSPQ
ncbi:hypothetical protein niasHT_028798 [Heterodera trifolii]|uniref:MATH domain-containing protein n=1 Tax=Heterodera trifolii TaxID=157864 RepID=A0ABD2KQF4_9BILA